MQTKLFIISLISLTLGGFLGTLFSAKKASPSKLLTLSDSSGQCGATTIDDESIIIDDKTFTKESLPLDLKNALHEIQSESYAQKQQLLQDFAVRYLMALDQNKFTSLEQLPPLQNLITSDQVSENDVKDFYEKNKNRMPPGLEFDKIKEQLEGMLKREKLQNIFKEKLQEYQSKNKFKINISAPIAPVVQIDITKYPKIGNNSKNILIEASDYLCSHCKHTHPEVKKLLEKYGDKITYVQMNYALRPNALSGEMVRGAFCAQKQSVDKFWVYHNSSFEYEGTDPITPELMAKKAQLNINDFNECLKSDESKASMEETNLILSGAGVTGTPTFFLNFKKLKINSHNLVEEMAKLL